MAAADGVPAVAGGSKAVAAGWLPATVGCVEAISNDTPGGVGGAGAGGAVMYPPRPPLLWQRRPCNVARVACLPRVGPEYLHRAVGMVVARVKDVARYCCVVQLRPSLPVHEIVLKKRHTKKAPFLTVNSSCGDALLGFEGKAAWLSFCAASFAVSAKTCPREHPSREHTRTPWPQASLRGAARCHGDFIPTLYYILHYPIVLLLSGGGVLHGDSHGGAEVTEVLAGPERITVATNTPNPRPRFVGEVDDTQPEDGHGVRLATNIVGREVARCNIDNTEHVVVAAYGGVRAAHVDM